MSDATATPGIKDEWKVLPRKRCRNCPTIFKPKRPEQKFCSDKCRDEFKRHGGAFVKLRDLCMKEIPALVSSVPPALFQTCPTCGGSGRMHAVVKDGRIIKTRREQRGDGNVECNGCRSRWWSMPENRGKVLTEFGQDLESFVRLLVEDMTAKGPDD